MHAMVIASHSNSKAQLLNVGLAVEPIGVSVLRSDEARAMRHHPRTMVVPILIGRSLRLRPPVPADVDERLALGQAPEILRMFGADPSEVVPLTHSGAAAFIDGLAAHPSAWVIEYQSRFLGEIRLDCIDLHDRRAQLAVGLYDPARLSKGIGREAIQLVLGHAFEVLHLHRVGLRVISYNERAIRAYKACGFLEEGREREAALVSGTWHDDVIMGILVTETVALR